MGMSLGLLEFILGFLQCESPQRFGKIMQQPIDEQHQCCDNIKQGLA
jgi:hypothetical protein